MAIRILINDYSFIKGRVSVIKNKSKNKSKKKKFSHSVVCCVLCVYVCVCVFLSIQKKKKEAVLRCIKILFVWLLYSLLF